MDTRKEIEELANALRYVLCDDTDYCDDCAYREYGDCENRKIANRIYEAGYRKADEVRKEIAGLKGKVEALRKDKENLRRTLEEGRSYEYRNSCAGCELENICKYAEHYNFCEDCKEYPDCPIIGYDELPCGRTVECNNGFEEKSYLDDLDDEDEEGEDE